MQNNTTTDRIAMELLNLSLKKGGTPPPTVTITNGFKVLEAIEEAVRAEIQEVSKESRRSVLTMYKTAFFFAYRGIIKLTKDLEEGGEL